MKYLSLILVILTVCFLMGCSKDKADVDTVSAESTETSVAESAAEENKEEPTEASETKRDDGLIIEDAEVGDGEEVHEGDTVKVHYTGLLTDGTCFDSSKKRNSPFTFTVGAGSVIKGWDEGLIGMKVGGKRLLTIPPELGYGDKDMGDIPPNSTLCFEIELLDIAK